MLRLTIREGESIWIGDDIEVVVVTVGPGKRVGLAVEAPRSIPIERTELVP